MNNVQPSGAPSQNGSAQPIKKPRRQRAVNPKFPCTMNFGITAQMALAVTRQSPRSSPFSQSDIGRIALHAWLLANDEGYRRDMTDGANHNV